MGHPDIGQGGFLKPESKKAIKSINGKDLNFNLHSLILETQGIKK